MARLDDLQTALVNADKAGDTQAAEALAAEIVKLRGQQSPQQGQRSLGEDVVRQGKMLGLEVVKGAAQLATLPLDALSDVASLGKGVVSALRGRGFEEGLYKGRRPSEAVTEPITKIQPQPENVLEHGAAITANVLGGAGSGIAAGRKLAAKTINDFAPAPSKKAPELAELRNQANQAYTRAEKAGVVISKQSFGNTVKNIEKEALDEGLDPTLHPRVTAALKRLTDATGKDLSFREADTLRRVVQGAAKSVEPDERRIARIILDKLDDYVGSLKPDDVVSGDPKVATKAIGEARNLWSRFRKGEAIEELITRAKNRAAQFSGSGYENALRTEFRNLAQNKKRMRTFSEAEQEAIRKVARGGPFENALRFLGKFAPTGVVSATLGGGAGYAVGGPAGSLALFAVSGAGRLGAKKLTERNARLTSELARLGGVKPGGNPLMSLGRTPVFGAAGATGSNRDSLESLLPHGNK